MLCSYDDFCSIICTVLRGRYCVIQHLCCITNKTIIITHRPTLPTKFSEFSTSQKYHLKCCYAVNCRLFFKAKLLKVALDSDEQKMRVDLARDGEQSDTLAVAAV